MNEFTVFPAQYENPIFCCTLTCTGTFIAQSHPAAMTFFPVKTKFQYGSSCQDSFGRFEKNFIKLRQRWDWRIEAKIVPDMFKKLKTTLHNLNLDIAIYTFLSFQLRNEVCFSRFGGNLIETTTCVLNWMKRSKEFAKFVQKILHKQ